jgi:hypothetical protein
MMLLFIKINLNFFETKHSFQYTCTTCTYSQTSEKQKSSVGLCGDRLMNDRDSLQQMLGEGGGCTFLLLRGGAVLEGVT